MTSAETRTQIVKDLLSWYKKNKRPLPWRENANPYKIWIAEVMLQQTQVSRVLLYYNRFLKRFPNLTSLSEASWSSLLPYWRGLGYYNRARNLQKSAKLIKKHFQGRIPKEQKTLRSLPGIGDYTSAAICCFAFGEPLPALDTNLRRVFSRLLGTSGKTISQKSHVLFQEHHKHAPTLNHALMDLGALLCKGSTPHCHQCPLKNNCYFFQSKTSSLPSSASTKPRKKPPQIRVGIACIHHEGRYLIGKTKRNAKILWEFPGGKCENGESVRSCIKREGREELGVELAVRPPFLIVTRLLEGQRVELNFCRAQILRGRPRNLVYQTLRWIPPNQFQNYSFPTPNKKALRILQSLQHKNKHVSH